MPQLFSSQPGQQSPNWLEVGTYHHHLMPRLIISGITQLLQLHAFVTGAGTLPLLYHACVYKWKHLTFWHWSFTFNSNKWPTWSNNFSVYYPEVCLQSTCFGRFPAHHQELNDCSGSLWFYLRIVVIVVLCSWLGRPAGRPDHEHRTTVTTIRR
jgi:hypothetical protein